MNQTVPDQPQAITTTIPAPHVAGITTPNVEQSLQSKRTPRSVIVLLLFLLPPLAWYFMWRDKTYHHWLAKILFLSAIGGLTFTLFFNFVIVGQLSQLYASVGLEQVKNQSLVSTTLWWGILSAILQIFFSLHLLHTIKKNGALHPVQLFITIFFLAVGLYMFIIPPLLITQDLYPALESLYQGTY